MTAPADARTDTDTSTDTGGAGDGPTSARAERGGSRCPGRAVGGPVTRRWPPVRARGCRVPILGGVPVEVARTRAARRRGLLGRDRLVGVLVLVPCRQVHTIGLRRAIDVAFCAGDGRVLRVVTMRPGRVSRPVLRSRFVLEGPAGSFGGWGITRGARLTVRACSP